jgi:TatD DNase family protein
MNLPKSDDYIDIHNHGTHGRPGYFQVENLMTHENRFPDIENGLAYTIGIHPWFLTAENFQEQIGVVRQYADHKNIIAVGEAGFDRLKGPEFSIQRKAFAEQIRIANEVSKPVVIHCVRAWDELLSEHKKLRPATPWLVHGFRGRRELAMQLLSKGMYLSFWFDFIVKPESTPLIKSLPVEKIFLETDGSSTDIKTIYEKVAADLNITGEQLKKQIFLNYKVLFKT